MDLLPSSASKYDFNGIGRASASVIMAAIASYPPTAWLAAGLQGKIIFFLLDRFMSSLASMGVVALNVGAEKLLVAAEKSKYDGSFDTAFKLIEQIRATGRDLTEEEIKNIDDAVIKQFRKFARLTRRRG